MFLLLIKDNTEYLKTVGVEESNLGTHSCRKGVMAMVYADFTVYPPIASLFIRAGWFMGGVKYKYLKRESSGDQYAGRHVSGLNHIEKRLLLHPHTLISLQLRIEFLKSRQKKRSNTGFMIGYYRTILCVVNKVHCMDGF